MSLDGQDLAVEPPLDDLPEDPELEPLPLPEDDADIPIPLVPVFDVLPEVAAAEPLVFPLEPVDDVEADLPPEVELLAFPVLFEALPELALELAPEVSEL